MSMRVNKSPFEIAFSKNPIFFEISTTEVSMSIDLYIESFHKSGNFSKVLTKSLMPDISGKGLVKLQSYLDTYLNYEIPAYAESQIKLATSHIKRFYLVANSYNAAGTIIATLTINNSGSYYTVVKGGISHEEFPTAGFFQNYLPDNKIFLSWRGNNILTDINQPEFLYYLAPSATASPVFKCKFYYSDGSNSLYSQNLSAINKYDLSVIPVGVPVLQGFATSGKFISYYEIWLETSTAAVISEKISYTVDYNRYRSTRYFHYFNSLGGLDTLKTRGITEFAYPVDSEFAQVGIPVNYKASQGSIIEFNIEESQTIKTATGYMTLEELDHLRDLFLSRLVVFIKDEQYLTVIVKKDGLKYSEEEDLYSAVITYSYNFNNVVYTPAKLRTIQPETYRRLINDSGDKKLISINNFQLNS